MSAATYRYTLTRDWALGIGRVCWVMLNPSTADETADDPTIRRCIRFSQDAGYQSLVVVNLFAARTTDPKHLLAFDDPHGPVNYMALASETARADRVVFAWGAYPHLTKLRAIDVEAMCARRDITPYCLGTTKHGAPKHPLYVPAAQPFVPFVAASGSTGASATDGET